MRGLTTIVTITCLLAALPAQAQPAAVDGRVPTWNESHNEEGNRAVITLYRLATCAQRSRRAAAETFLNTERGSADERTAVQALITFGANTRERCLTGGATHFRINSGDALRGAVAESTYNGDAIRPRDEAPLPSAPGVASSGRTIDMVGCAVARAPMIAHRILQVNYGSPTETRFLRQFNAHLLNCLPQGASLRASRLAVRTSIADALLSAARLHRELFINA